MAARYQYWLDALKYWSVTDFQLITAWDVAYITGETYLADAHWHEWTVAQAGQRTLCTNTRMPWSNASLCFNAEGEALVRINGRSTYGINPFHHSFQPNMMVGEEISLTVDQVATGLMGMRVHRPGISLVRWEKVDGEIERTYWDLLALTEWLSQDDVPASLATWLQGRLDKALLPLYSLVPDEGAQRNWAHRKHRAAEEEGLYRALQSGKTIPGLYLVDYSRLSQSIGQVRRELALIYDELPQKAPAGHGRLLVLGHAHIDLAWLWPLSETIMKVTRTVASQRYLLDRFPEWRFGMSSPEMWQWLQKHDAAQYDDWEMRAKEGRVVPLGAFWVESDGQLVGAETIFRHLLYGLRYFEKITGQRPQIAFLPDTFGFAEGLPTLLAQAGIQLLLTTKINWNDTTRFPYKHFRWVGPDASWIQMQIFGSSPDGYNGTGSLSDLKAAWNQYASSAGGHHTVLYTLGHGDGGGGPDEDMLQRLSRYRRLPLVPELCFDNPDTLILQPEDADGLPIYQGELYLQYHRAVFTSQSAVKSRFRQIPNRIVAAEAWGLLSGIPTDLSQAWQLILRNSFHDIIPGSSIAAVYRDFHGDLDSVERTVENVENLAVTAFFPSPEPTQSNPLDLDQIKNPSVSLVVGNRSGFAAPPQLVVISSMFAPEIFFDGEWHQGYLVNPNQYLVPLPLLPPLGVIAIPIRPSLSAGKLLKTQNTGPLTVATNQFLVTISSQGIQSFYHQGRELLADTAGVAAFFQHPEQFDAWELVDPHRRGSSDMVHEPLVVTEDNPYRLVARLRHHIEHSTVTEHIIVDRCHGRLQVKISAILSDRHLTLQYRIPTTINAPLATAETMWGTTSHATIPQGPEDSAEFEWVAHRFVDLAEPHQGLALLNDGRYGHSVTGGEIRVTMVTTPLYPDPSADQEMAPLTLAWHPHHQHWTDAGVMKAAHALSHPPWMEVRATKNIIPMIPLGHLPDNIALLAFKPAEDGSGDYIVHLGEMWGDSTDFWVSWPQQVSSVCPVDLVSERPKANPLGLESQSTRLHINSRGFMALRAQITTSTKPGENAHGL